VTPEIASLSTSVARANVHPFAQDEMDVDFYRFTSDGNEARIDLRLSMIRR